MLRPFVPIIEPHNDSAKFRYDIKAAQISPSTTDGSPFGVKSLGSWSFASMKFDSTDSLSSVHESPREIFEHVIDWSPLGIPVEIQSVIDGSWSHESFLPDPRDYEDLYPFESLFSHPQESPVASLPGNQLWSVFDFVMDPREFGDLYESTNRLLESDSSSDIACDPFWDAFDIRDMAYWVPEALKDPVLEYGSAPWIVNRELTAPSDWQAPSGWDWNYKTLLPDPRTEAELKEADAKMLYVDWSVDGIPAKFFRQKGPKELMIDWTCDGLPAKFLRISEQGILAVNWSANDIPLQFRNVMDQGMLSIDWSVDGLPSKFLRASGDAMLYIDWSVDGLPKKFPVLSEEMTLDWSKDGLPKKVVHILNLDILCIDWSISGIPKKFGFESYTDANYSIDWSIEGLPELMQLAEYIEANIPISIQPSNYSSDQAICDNDRSPVNHIARHKLDRNMPMNRGSNWTDRFSKARSELKYNYSKKAKKQMRLLVKHDLVSVFDKFRKMKGKWLSQRRANARLLKYSQPVWGEECFPEPRVEVVSPKAKPVIKVQKNEKMAATKMMPAPRIGGRRVVRRRDPRRNQKKTKAAKMRNMAPTEFQNKSSAPKLISTKTSLTLLHHGALHQPGGRQGMNHVLVW
jgi:hypothetical protein